ncbi:MAG: UvrD-helicase domain-containing protein [bacterium]|nr:UvrD-helicase domain-containing protein [bacterium]
MSEQMHQLNSQQKEAVETTSGPLLILAGAGAGKTKTIAHRILNLVKSGVEPSKILAITFTNKAAKEMRDRVIGLLRSDKSLNMPVSMNQTPFVSTFHALGVHIIKENSILAGLPRHFTIFDRSDSKRAVKAVLEELELDPKQFEPGAILNAISREKGNGVTASEYMSRLSGSPQEFYQKTIGSVWEKYEKTLAREKSADFDDLLLKTAVLLQKNESVRKHYQHIWRYIHVDEYQDVNKVQYQMMQLLASNERNICVVGDVDQCLLPDTWISVPGGNKKIKDIKEKDKIISAAGNGSTCETSVERVISRKYSGEVITISTKKGSITATPNHILFSSLSLKPDCYYVYLMYKREKGYRIGMVKSIRKGKKDKEIGLLVRCNQEHADKMWILKMCSEKSEALYWEVYFSSKYGIPGLVFSNGNRRMVIKQSAIDELYSSIDTVSRAGMLFKDSGLFINYPHYVPQGTTTLNTLRDRINIRVSMFDDPRRSLISPWGLSRVSVNATDSEFKDTLIAEGFPVRKGKRDDWRMEISHLDYGNAEEIAQKIYSLRPHLTVRRSVSLIPNKKMFFHPAGNIIPGMTIGILEEGKIIEQEVIDVKKSFYEGVVYDLNIKNTHNYIANSTPVHNCIYSWRGADIKNILNFEKDYAEAKVVVLEENYRSTQTILAAANNVIQKNVMRRKKNLFTKNPEGEKIALFISYTEKEEARIIADTARDLIEKGVNPKEISVLYRANFQSRILEESFLNKNIPYQMLGVRFFERKEIKDTLSFIKAALNRESSGDMARVINIPPRGIGKVTMLKILAGNKDALPPAMRIKVSQFFGLLDRIKDVVATSKPSDTIKYILRETGMEMMYKNGSPEEQEKLENLRELASVATQYDSLPPEDGIESLLSNAALATDQDELEKEKDAVKLMTVHASKGLEFDYVFIAGLEQDLFPHQRLNESDISQSEAEEERRLFYVAVTRARKKVFLSYAQLRTIYGSQKVNTPSEFISDIGDEHLEPDVENADEKPRGVKAIFIDF